MTRKQKTLHFLIACLVLPTALFAGEDFGMFDDSEWRVMVSGKTVEYSINGELFVREYYWPGQDVVTMEVVGKECFEARWEFNPKTSTFCFHNGPTACFWHLREGGHLYVQLADPGVSFGAIQDITAISDVRLACSTAPTS